MDNTWIFVAVYLAVAMGGCGYLGYKDSNDLPAYAAFVVWPFTLVIAAIFGPFYLAWKAGDYLRNKR